jgi:hypothetical protein
MVSALAGWGVFVGVMGTAVTIAVGGSVSVAVAGTAVGTARVGAIGGGEGVIWPRQAANNHTIINQPNERRFTALLATRSD